MTLYKLLAVLSLVGAVAAGSKVVHESLAAAPGAFVSNGAAHPSDMITLRVGLAPSNIAGLEAKLTSISTPGSPDHRQWLSVDEVPHLSSFFPVDLLTRNVKVKNFVRPSSDTVSAFNKFASSNGLNTTVISPNEDWVSITLPVAQANDLFDAQYEVFSHPAMSNTITRTLSVSLPPELVGHVQVMHPTTAFAAKPGNRMVSITSEVQLDKRQTPASCNTHLTGGIMTPTCLQSLYGIPTTPANQSNNALLVTAYNQFAQITDLQVRVAQSVPVIAELSSHSQQFLQSFRPDINPSETFTLLSADGGVNTQNAPINDEDEANLDIQYTAGPFLMFYYERRYSIHIRHCDGDSPSIPSCGRRRLLHRHIGHDDLPGRPCKPTYGRDNLVWPN